MWLHIWLVYGIEWTEFILFMYLLQLCYIYVYILVDGDLLNKLKGNFIFLFKHLKYNGMTKYSFIRPVQRCYICLW